MKRRALEKQKTYERGRRCDTPACITRLSIYNEGPYCFCCAAKIEAAVAAEEARRQERPRGTAVRAARLELITRERADGKTWRALGEMLGISGAAVSQWYAKHAEAERQAA